MNQDIVADLPDELAVYKHEHGKLPEGVDFEPGYICQWQDKYFVHARATLPLKDTKNGVGFGLWVQIPKADYEKYLRAEKDDVLYKSFRAEGTLANNWPGFLDTYGLPVVVKTVFVDQKIYIWEVKLDRRVDPLFEVSLLSQKHDERMKEQIRKLAVAYLQDFNKEA